MKYLCLIILFALVTTQLVLAETFQIGATVPQIVGVNYFPESNTDKTTAVHHKERVAMSTQMTLRNGKQVLLQTNVVK